MERAALVGGSEEKRTRVDNGALEATMYGFTKEKAKKDRDRKIRCTVNR